MTPSWQDSCSQRSVQMATSVGCAFGFWLVYSKHLLGHTPNYIRRTSESLHLATFFTSDLKDIPSAGRLLRKSCLTSALNAREGRLTVFVLVQVGKLRHCARQRTAPTHHQLATSVVEATMFGPILRNPCFSRICCHYFQSSGMSFSRGAVFFFGASYFRELCESSVVVCVSEWISFPFIAQDQ